VGQWNADLLRNSPDIDEILVYNSPVFARGERATPIRSRWRLLRELNENKPDLMLGLRDDAFTILLALLIFPRLRVDRGSVRFHRKMRMLRGAHPVAHHELETNMAIVRMAGVEAAGNQELIRLADMEKAWLDNFLSGRGLRKRKYSVMHPGASWNYRRWSSSNFAMIIDFLFDHHGLRTVLVGHASEGDLGRVLESAGETKVLNMIGKTSLREMLCLISESCLFIGNDSGPMHVAAVMNVPTIGLLGPNDPTRFSPKGENVLWFHHKVECNPCNQRVCKYPDRPCVDLISTDEVIAGIMKHGIVRIVPEEPTA
jgi:ADP-heptose:LPS heptosyltransferase